MSSFRIRRDSREFLVEGEAALLRLARGGALKGEDRLREEPDGLWTDASVHPLLWEIFQADPWSAWEDLDAAEDPEEIWAALAMPAEPSAPPAPAVAPQDELDAETLAPVPAASTPRKPRRRRASKVAPGTRWSGPIGVEGLKVPATEPDLRPGVRVPRPAGIKLDSEGKGDRPGTVRVAVPATTRVEPAAADATVPPAGATVPPAGAAVPPAGATVPPASRRLPPPADTVVHSQPGGPPLPGAAGVMLPEVGPRGQVIAFPERSRVGGSRTGAEPAARLDDPPLPSRAPPLLREPVRDFAAVRKPEPQTIGLSLWRVGLVVLLAGAAVAAVVWWVKLQSEATFDNIPVVEAPRPPGAAAPASASVEDPTDAIIASAGPDDPESEEAAILRELRDRLPVGSQEVRSAEELEQALLIELSRLQILGVIIKADIVSWAGDEENPVPDEIELSIQADSRGEPEREIAAIGLVVGKYITHLDLRPLALEVILVQEDGTARAKRLDPESAALLYRKEIGLKEFLLSR